MVALVGYTNAGKSTLFNALTKAGVFADNRLFATLDPTLRRIDAAARRGGRPLRHGRLRLRPADDAGRRLPRDAGGGGRGRPHPARPRHRPSRQRGAGGRRRRGARPNSASTRARPARSSRSGTRSTCCRRRSGRRASIPARVNGDGSAPGGRRGLGADRRGAARASRRDRAARRRRPAHLSRSNSPARRSANSTGSTSSARCSTATDTRRRRDRRPGARAGRPRRALPPGVSRRRSATAKAPRSG